MFSGAENLLVWDDNACNLTNVYFGLESAFGIILSIKEDSVHGGEAEIYSDGEILILPWIEGQRPELSIIKEVQIC